MDVEFFWGVYFFKARAMHVLISIKSIKVLNMTTVKNRITDMDDK